MSKDKEEKQGREIRVSRRGFLRAAGVGAAAAAFGGVVPFASSRAYAQGGWDDEVDVVVVGSGVAGATAAIVAHEEGANVLMLEKAPAFGGTSAKSGGVYHIPNNSLMNSNGIEDPRDDAIRYYARCSYPHIYNPNDARFGLPELEYSLIAAYYDNGSQAVDRLRELGALESTPWMSWDQDFFPDYYAQFPENKAPRGRGLVPRKPDGSAGTGAELMRQLQAAVRDRGIPVLLGHPAERLVENENGEVVGIEARNGDGEVVSTRARQAVIFASGGFTHDPRMRLHFLRGPIFGGCAVPTNTGDFVNVGGAAGASLGNMNDAWLAQIVLEQALQFSSVPDDMWQTPGDSVIQVNRYGQRVVNEKIQYNERTRSHFVWDPVRGEYTNLVLFMVYDQRTADTFGGSYPIPDAGANAPYVISGNTFEELAANVRARLDGLADRTGGFQLDDSFAAGLQQSVERFNGYAESGVDEEFHRGEVPVELAFNGPARPGNDKPNPTMYPISSEGPYYSIILAGGTLDTNGGPRTNDKAQVLHALGNPIKGLYGAGNCIASPAGQAYWAGGGTIGPAMTYGYIAAKNAVRESVKEAAVAASSIG